ncbi:tryptophan synthase subunit alpha [Candidatus Roizmanbacteria bacterium RIFCSPHIGHO2_01_FULL_39_8]|uniref:Tryptophan synthase alpha chain n=3 Tax=Candidatus Roizmaniibacteriota TaxID=1752723 RepID=A0A1F7GUE0_9BACT|nr:MAG: tryptophan synthase subunit alpha [Candidatus Roizmanbacteria bacterium RIFCSPHIGHO2_01_FULL_39_8]OGK27904.1 MAG: tryptophan synthase subunit alpha [Candidatus Roizmanbacteria bacterium RIFCSPHIGHO2_02_FULL_39_9]OGK36668.1 MAG: tryptophan synthase subunit alpha [Candidatus Roizmanbacteria bacterium RIFCSPHIGHO2_12_FULL_39_8]
MNKIDQKINGLKKCNRIGLMTHLVLGYPNPMDSLKLAKILIDAGSDFVELQIPFSDPIADGPTIMHASEVALRNGATVTKCLELLQKITVYSPIPVLVMCYYNTVFSFGVEEFCHRMKSLNISGLIVPDIPVDEEKNEKFVHFCLKYDLYLIRVISPASSKQRLTLNAKRAKGFVYCISRFGVTGTKSTLDPTLQNYLSNVKKYFSIPIAVGFGISKKEHIDSLQNKADIAIVGSAIIDQIEKSRNYRQNYLDTVKKFIINIKH